MAKVETTAPVLVATRGDLVPKPSEEKVVVTGRLRLAVEDGPKTVDAIRAFVASLGGRVVNENLVGRDRTWSGDLRVRVPPDQVTPLVDWLERRGDVEERRVEAIDVAKEYFDQELALKNLRVTAERLQALLQREAQGMKDVLEVERELTRVRGEIERIEGEHRFLDDRIALATLDLEVRMRGEAVFAPRAKLHPGPRGSLLFRLDAEDEEEELRLGGGLTLHFDRAYTMDLDVYPARGMERRAILATLGGAAYSDFLGSGRRRFGNPYLGLRLGYAWLDERSMFAFAGEAGVELFKIEWVLVDVSVRALGLAHGDGVETALQGGLSVQVPF
jgi:hypothetical protein